MLAAAALRMSANGWTSRGQRHRVLVSTDIGGTDPDDFQSMVHLLLYADTLEIEGLVSSPFGPGRKRHLLQVLDCYEQDFSNLRTHSPLYPEPDALRALCKQGATESPGPAGVGKPTEGSEWIIRCARRADPRPLYVLVWGGIEDLAQALHDAPDILPRIRVYFIGSTNKSWSVDAYNSIEQHHRNLWIIESNQTFRGWYIGGDQGGDRGNRSFVTAHVAGRGALGRFFAEQLDGTIKMGDSPSVGYLLHGTPEDPSQPGWGGRFVRAWDGRKTVFRRMTTSADTAEAFGVVEWILPAPEGMQPEQQARMIFGPGLPAAAGARENNSLRFSFSPRQARIWQYVIESGFPALDGQRGEFTAVLPPPERAARPSAAHPNWWIDDPGPSAAEGVHQGARHVNRWREHYLRDFAERMRRCAAPAKR